MTFINDEGVYCVGDMRPGDTLVTERPPLPVPSSVTPLQARRAMRQAGVLEAVKAAVAANPEMQDAFDYAAAFQRKSVFVAQAQFLLCWTDEQIDDLFRRAAAIED